MERAPEGRLAALREQSRKGLDYLLNYLLANADQYLLALASRAGNKLEQASFHEAMRELRLKRRGLEQHFTTAVMNGFDAPIAAPEAPPPPARRTVEPPPLTLDIGALGLMREERLEETLAVEDLASRARAEHRDALLAIARHVATEAGQRRVDVDALPIGPVALARAFLHACSEIEVAPESRIVFLKLFSRFIAGELGAFYAGCLAVLPVEESDDREPGEPAVTEPELENLPTRERGDDLAVAGPEHAQAELPWDSARTPLLAAPGKAMALPRNVLDQVLLTLQQQLLDRKRALSQMNPKGGVQPFEVFELINGSLEEMGYTKPMALTRDFIETANLVRLLFDMALRDPTVPLPVRRLARLLQIPVLRAALQDQDVLSDAEHPVRALFRDMGNAAVGWTPDADPAKDELLHLLQSITSRIVAGYGTDLEVFTICGRELAAHIRSVQERSRLFEQRTLSAEVGRTERDSARADVNCLIDSAIGDTPLPEKFVEFLRGAWSDAMFVTLLREGEGSVAWRSGKEATGKLVAAGAQDSAQALAALSVRLREGLERLGLDDAAVAGHLRVLEAAIGASAPVAQETVVGDSVQRTRPAASADFLHIVDKLAPDTWFEFRLPGHPPARARLLTKFPKTGEFLFVNREGAKASDWKRDELAAALQSGEAILLTGPNAPVGPVSSARWGRR